MAREFLNIKQVQATLGISQRTVFRYIQSGDLKGFKLGKEWKFEPSDIDDFIQRRRQKAEQQLREKQDDKEPQPV